MKNLARAPGPGPPQIATAPVATKAAQIVTWLRRRRDPQRAPGVQQYFRHQIVALGIDTPTLREFAAAQSKQLKFVWSLREATALCDRLLQEPELEIRGIGILILSAWRRELVKAALPRSAHLSVVLSDFSTYSRVAG